jgi:hypothetical protein
MLYMFQAVSPPIIRSSNLYTQRLVCVKLAFAATASVGESNSPTLAVAASKLDIYQTLCVQLWAPDDGRKNRLKHVENWQ